MGRLVRKPLKAPMEKLLLYKQGAELQKRLAKRMANGVYGLTGQEWTDQFGPHFNSVWFASISTRARLQVADLLYSHGIGPGDNEGYKTLLSVDVDGTKLTQEIDVTNDKGWSLKYEGPALIISSGLVYTETTKPKGLHLKDVLAMIKAHPRLEYYETKVKRRLTLGDALAQNRMEDLGKEMDFSVSISLLNQDHDRDFPKMPRSGGQLLNNKYRSQPRRV